MQSSSHMVANNKPAPSILQAGHPSCHPTNSVKLLKGKDLPIIHDTQKSTWTVQVSSKAIHHPSTVVIIYGNNWPCCATVKILF